MCILHRGTYSMEHLSGIFIEIWPYLLGYLGSLYTFYWCLGISFCDAFQNHVAESTPFGPLLYKKHQ